MSSHKNLPESSAKPAFLSVAEVARSLSLSTDVVERLIRAGEIAHRRQGRRIQIPRQWFEDYCQRLINEAVQNHLRQPRRVPWPDEGGKRRA